MDRWERRERKLEARKQRMAKHGRSLLTAVQAAELRRAAAAQAKATAADWSPAKRRRT